MFMHLELTGKCNLGCVHCYNNKYNTQISTKKELGHNQWLKLIKEANELGCEGFNFSGGEPLLYQKGDHKKLLELVNECNSPIVLLTNGHNLTNEILQKLIATNKLKAIRLSLDGLKSHDLFRRNGDHKLILERIRMVKEESKIPLAVVTMLNNGNTEEIIPLYEKLKDLSIDWWNLDVPFYTDFYKKASPNFRIPSYQKIIKISKDILMRYFEDGKPFRVGIANIYKSQIAKTSYHEFDTEAHPCCYRDIVCIKPTGEIHACAAYDKKVADVKKASSLREIRLISKKHPFYSMKILDIKGCLKCRYLKICGGGCRADAWYLTESNSNPDPKCCSLLPLVESEIFPILPQEERDVLISLCDENGEMPKP